MKATPGEKAEARAIAALHRVEKVWPKGLWVWSADHILYVMRRGPDGEHVITSNGGVDPDYVIDTIGIPSDGGDW